MATVYEERAKVFRALCDERRQRILELLHSGEKCACVLIDELDIPQSSLSYHMKILCDSGIVTGRREGKWMYYRIDEDGCEYASQLMEKIRDHDTDGLIKILMRLNRLFRKDHDHSGSRHCCCGDYSEV